MSQPQFFEYVCPYCQVPQRFPVIARGKRGRCSACGTVFHLPETVVQIGGMAHAVPVEAGSRRPPEVILLGDEPAAPSRRSISVVFVCVVALLLGGGLGAAGLLIYLNRQFEAGMDQLAQPVPGGQQQQPKDEKDLSHLVPSVACLGGRRPYGHAVLVEHQGQLYLATLREQLRYQEEKIPATFFDASGKALLTEEVTPVIGCNAPFAEAVLLGFTGEPDKLRGRLQELGIRPVPLAKNVRDLRAGDRLYALGRTGGQDFAVSEHPRQTPARVCLLPSPAAGADLQIFSVDWLAAHTVLPAAPLFNPDGELVGLYAQFVRLPEGPIAENNPVIGADQIRQLLEAQEVQVRGKELLQRLNLVLPAPSGAEKSSPATRPGGFRTTPPELLRFTPELKMIHRPFALARFNTHVLGRVRASQRVLLVFEVEHWPEPTCQIEIFAQHFKPGEPLKVIREFTFAEKRAVLLFDPPAPGVYGVRLRVPPDEQAKFLVHLHAAVGW
jgi:hypothetical protein